MEFTELTPIKMRSNKYKKKKKKEFKIKIIIYFICVIISFFSGLLIGSKLLQKPKMRNIRNYNKILDIYNFTTYSQCLEDFILYCIFYDIDNGFYIDVGANDPNVITVTKAFYLNGWHGINIEPLPDMYKKLLNDRSRDINLNIGASEKEDTLSLFLHKEGSTVNKKIFKEKGETINITVYPLSKICKEYVPKNEEIQFCKIDVEGHEKSVLLGFDFENYRPKVFCIESTAPATYIPTHEEWEYILIRNGYAFGFAYNINRYYYDTKVDYLNGRFLNLENYVNLYKKIQKNKKK